MNQRLIFIIAIVFSFCANINAQIRQDSVLINFRQSKVYLDTAYMDNTRSLSHALRTIDFYSRPDSGFVLTQVAVVGGASPEGSVKFNEWLSRQRAKRIFEYMGSHLELPDSITSYTFLGRDWEGLRRMVMADSEVPFRNDVLHTLDYIINNYHQGENEAQGNLSLIKKLHSGIPYTYMYRHHFPQLRASLLILTFESPQKRPHMKSFATPAPVLDVNLQTAPPGTSIRNQSRPKAVRPFYMALKTNTLYDALAVPNIGAEFYLGRNISVVGNWMYGWWHSDRLARYWRIYGGDIALRWWFGTAARKKPLTGHHLGVYGSLLTYDFEWGGTGYMGGIPHGTLWDKCNHFGGIEYGYSLPVARRLNIDFNIGIGYQGGVYQIYDPVDGCYVYRETRRRNYWGPTKAEISLVWLIGRGNYNKKYTKGGNK